MLKRNIWENIKHHVNVASKNITNLKKSTYYSPKKSRFLFLANLLSYIRTTCPTKTKKEREEKSGLREAVQ